MPHALLHPHANRPSRPYAEPAYPDAFSSPERRNNLTPRDAPIRALQFQNLLARTFSLTSPFHGNFSFGFPVPEIISTQLIFDWQAVSLFFLKNIIPSLRPSSPVPHPRQYGCRPRAYQFHPPPSSASQIGQYIAASSLAHFLLAFC